MAFESIRTFRRTGLINGRIPSVPESKRNIIKTEMGDWFNTHPSFHLVNKIDFKLNVLQSNIGAVIEDEGSLRAISGMKKMTTIDAEFEKGDYFSFNNSTWLVIKRDLDNTVYARYFVRSCNFNLSFINDVGANVSIPCVYESKNPYSAGVSENKYIQLGDNQRAISIQNNVETMKFEREDEFKIGDLIYRISSIDRETEPEVFFIVLTEYQEGQIEPNTYSLDIQQSDLSFNAGQTEQLSVIVKEDNVIVERPIVYESSDVGVATVNTDGLVTGVANGTCVITASLRDNDAVNDTVNIEITDTITDNIEYRFGSDNSNELIVFDTNEYDFNKYINNVIDPISFTFEIDYNSNPTNIATLQVVDGNNCRVVANTQEIFGTIYLTATEGAIERGRIEINVVYF